MFSVKLIHSFTITFLMIDKRFKTMQFQPTIKWLLKIKTKQTIFNDISIINFEHFCLLFLYVFVAVSSNTEL